MLSFEEWLNVCQDDINIELAENGADRELDFDSESEYEHRYEQYLGWYDDYFDGTLDKSKTVLFELYEKMFLSK